MDLDEITTESSEWTLPQSSVVFSQRDTTVSAITMASVYRFLLALKTTFLLFFVKKSIAKKSKFSFWFWLGMSIEI